MVDSRWDQSDAAAATPRCLNCGNHVTPQFARVFGDNTDHVSGCPACTTSQELYEGVHR